MSRRAVPRTTAHARATWAIAVPALLLTAGCTATNPEWAQSLSPCCGQDLIAKGIEPPLNRCADLVVDQKTAFQLMGDLTGSAVAQWEVRLIPGGPACIWRIWPGDLKHEPEGVQPDWVGSALEKEAGSQRAESIEAEPQDDKDGGEPESGGNENETGEAD